MSGLKCQRDKHFHYCYHLCILSPGTLPDYPKSQEQLKKFIDILREDKRLKVYMAYLVSCECTCKRANDTVVSTQGSHRLEKYLNFEGFLEKSLKIKSALKITGKSLKSLEKSFNSASFCRT